MINKEDAQKNGFTVIDTNESLLNDKNEIIERIKAILPNVVNSDNVLNIEALKDLIDISSTTANNQGYEVNICRQRHC